MIPEENSRSINYNDYAARRMDAFASFFQKYMTRFVYFIRWPVILLSFVWLISCVIMGVSIDRKITVKNFLSHRMRAQQAKDIADTILG